MRQMFTNSTPVPALAAAGVCTVSPDARFRVASPAVTRQLVAQLPQVHQARINTILGMAAGSYTGPETKPSVKLGGFRGVPPRGRPV